jgi:DNA-binding transcriptional ArsR family regulator
MKKNTKHLTANVMRKNAEKAALLLKQLANTRRLMILCLLMEGEKTVNDLVKAVGLSQSALSQHLAKMREAKLLASEKRGQMVYYSISSMQAQALLSTLCVMYCKS